MKAFILLVNKINLLLKWTVGIIIVSLAILIFYTVIARHFFSNPPIWSFDLSSWFTGMIVFLGGGYALLSDSHVKVDLFYAKFSPKLRSIMDILSYLIVIIISTIFIVKGMEQVLMNFEYKTVAKSGLNIFIWIKWSIVPLGSLLLAMQALTLMIERFYYLITGKEMIERGEY